MSSRRDFLKLAATTAASCFLPDSISKAGTIFGSKMLKIDMAGGPAKPNIIFLHADDLGYADLGCMGSDLHQTPNIDGLKADSLWFTNAYSTHSTCAPSRLGIMTGKYPARLGVINNGVNNQLTGQYTLAQAMKEAGYITCHLGKWHIGNNSQRPELRGFDVSIGSNQKGMPASFFYPFGNSGGKKVPDLGQFPAGSHLTDCLTEKAVRYIKEHKSETFFMNFCYYAVHTPIQALSEKVAKYKALITPGLRHDDAPYAGLTEHLDDSVGRILSTLDEVGIADNTIVVFFSDNGGTPRTDNYPMRDSKGMPYEGGTRVPMFVRWKGVTTAGDSCDVPVIGIDIYPTFVSMAGGKINPRCGVLDGVSLTGVMKKTESKIDRSLHWLRYPVKTHYVHNTNPPWVSLPYGAMRKGNYKIIEKFYTGPDNKQAAGYELYDLENDLSETTNLANSMPAKRDELIAEMRAWRKSVNAPVFDYHRYD